MTRSLTTLLAIAALLAIAPTASARTADPPLVPWTTLLPPLVPGGYEPTSADDCVAGRIQCVDKVIRVMERHLDELAERCDHDAIFALSYLRTTEEYRRASETPGFFEDPRFVNHEDAVFARFYFQAYAAWHEGRRHEVPRAWAIAFAGADERGLPAAGNLMLGISAHVNRDLPYVLAAIGLVKPDGTSRKRDHDQVNVFLNRVTDPLVAEIARRFDPSIDDGDQPGSLDQLVLFQTIQGWRELAWRNAELLAAADTPLERALAEAHVEASAATQSELLRRSLAYVPGLQSSAARDAWCAQHG
jgi:hypothetical protein